MALYKQIKVESTRHTATHLLEGISWQHVSKFKWSVGDTQQLTL